MGFSMITTFDVVCFFVYLNSGMVIYLCYKYNVLWKHYMKFARDANESMDQQKATIIRMLNTLEKLKNPKKETPVEATKDINGK
jgi:hypothetical protein